MHRTKTNCSKYLELYEASWNQLAAKMPRLEDYENGSIQTTWMISYERVRKDNLISGKLLQLWGYLDHQDVWYELFRRGEDGCLEEYGWLHELAGTEIGFKSVMQSLLDYSLIESHGDKENYSMHPVVHDWCTETISSGQVDLMLSALTVVSSAAPSASIDEGYEPWLLQQRLLERLLSHAHRCVRQIGDLEALHQLESIDASFSLLRLGNLFADQNKYVEAEKMYRLTLHGFEQAGGPHQLGIVAVVDKISLSCATQGKHDEAEQMYLWALGGYERIFGPDHSTTIDTVNKLGDLYVDQGKQAKAEESYRRALVGFEKAWGPDHTTFDAVCGLGGLYKDQGSHAEAEKIYRRALDVFEKTPNFDHDCISGIAYELSGLYTTQGKHVEAEDMFLRAMDEMSKWDAELTQTKTPQPESQLSFGRENQHLGRVRCKWLKTHGSSGSSIQLC